ncbi:uncharacterized protein LOC117787420 isoform X2 [Drosophila innubila]|uniref:uncharacterized protein LOC117787420 isoform X2 n=1 Tax=Drosophila innubila TaxID=198719 RepID=UPI00148C149E|nr:uncharacterized protein LOC117787420 isoform X2 [Drosophila innubila]
MAKRGAAQQLQTEVKTDEELEKFLARPGLLILEVYSEWCGPCLGVLGTLRRIKLEIGGENLHLAICRADTITALKRFYKRSEPTWLFATGGKAVSIFYGSDAPKLVAVIIRELEKTLQNASRPTYQIGDLQPIEAEVLRIKTEAIKKAERIEHEKQEKKRIDYLNRCTDVIMENLPDIGVTVFGPQVSRDMFKKLSEPAEHLKMQCKDRKYLEVFAKDFEIINYSCKNPLSDDVIDQLDGKELLVCFWKIDEASGPITHVLSTYAHELTKERVAPPDDEINVPHPIAPIISPIKVKFEVEIEDGEVWVEEISSEEEARKLAERKAAEKSKSATHLQDESRPKDQEGAEDDDEEEASEEEEAMQAVQPAFPNMALDIDLGLDDNIVSEEEMVEEEEEPPKPLTRIKRVKIPPIWVANNRRTHAALIYVFFRSQTSGFLPPDPPPEPPHVVMAFEAFKRDDVMEVVEASKEDVPQYGFFTNDTPGEAKLITNSIYKYDKLEEPSSSDRIVLKVNKVQSYTMLSLVQFEPTYCSNNVTSGRMDALKFFPEDYKTDEEIPPDAQKKQKKKKTQDASGVDESPKLSTETAKSIDIAAGDENTEDSPKALEGEAQTPEVQAGETLITESPTVADPSAVPTEGAPAAGDGTDTQEPPKEEINADLIEAPAVDGAAAATPAAPTDPAPME